MSYNIVNTIIIMYEYNIERVFVMSIRISDIDGT